MVRLATQDIDRAACQIIVSGLVGEQRPGIGISDEPSRSVAVKRALEGAHQQIAFGSVIVDDTQTAITTVILRPEILTHLGDVGDLTVDNALSRQHNFYRLRVFPPKGITSVWPVIQEERLTDLNEPAR